MTAEKLTSLNVKTVKKYCHESIGIGIGNRACERSVSVEKADPRKNLILQPPLPAPFPLRDLPLRALLRQ